MDRDSAINSRTVLEEHRDYRMTVIVAAALFVAIFLGGIGFFAFQDNLQARSAENRAAIAAGLQTSLANDRAQTQAAETQAAEAQAAQANPAPPANAAADGGGEAAPAQTAPAQTEPAPAN
jgi:hypothetical protein